MAGALIMTWESNYLSFKNTAALESLGANELRQKAFNRFTQVGLPTKQIEAWKYTSLSDFKTIDWSLVGEDVTVLTHEQMQEVSKQLPSEFINFVFVNGALNKTLSDDAESFLEINEIAEADFNFDEKNIEYRLLNLAQSFLHKKVTLRLSKHKTIDKPGLPWCRRTTNWTVSGRSRRRCASGPMPGCRP